MEFMNKLIGCVILALIIIQLVKVALLIMILVKLW